MKANISRLNRLLSAIRFAAVQVGAREGFTRELAPIAGAIDAVAFEADKVEAALLSEEARSDSEGYRTLRILPLAIASSGGQATLNLYRDRSWSSLQSADATVAKHHARGALFALEDSMQVDALTLDDAVASGNIANARYLRISATAAPLDVLRSGQNLIDGLCAIRARILFAPLYKNQPLFADIDAELRTRGFTLASLDNLQTWRRGTEAPPDRWSGGATPISEGQPIAADALYLRRAEEFPANTAAEQDRLIAHALIAFAHGHLDTTGAVLLRPPVRQRVLELCAIDVAVLLHDLGRWHARRRRRQIGAALAKQLGIYLRLSGR
jgi:hypothetical protein